jgi:hypothetical protein
MKPRVTRTLVPTIDKVLTDPQLLGAALGPVDPTWRVWQVVLKAMYGLPLDEEELKNLANALCICLRGLAHHLGYDILNPALYDESPVDAAAQEAWYAHQRERAYKNSIGFPGPGLSLVMGKRG